MRHGLWCVSRTLQRLTTPARATLPRPCCEAPPIESDFSGNREPVWVLYRTRPDCTLARSASEGWRHCSSLALRASVSTSRKRTILRREQYSRGAGCQPAEIAINVDDSWQVGNLPHASCFRPDPYALRCAEAKTTTTTTTPLPARTSARRTSSTRGQKMAKTGQNRPNQPIRMVHDATEGGSADKLGGGKKRQKTGKNGRNNQFDWSMMPLKMGQRTSWARGQKTPTKRPQTAKNGRKTATNPPGPRCHGRSVRRRRQALGAKSFRVEGPMRPSARHAQK